jgi:hypothetical protein
MRKNSFIATFSILTPIASSEINKIDSSLSGYFALFYCEVCIYLGLGNIKNGIKAARNNPDVDQEHPNLFTYALEQPEHPKRFQELKDRFNPMYWNSTPQAR